MPGDPLAPTLWTLSQAPQANLHSCPCQAEVAETWGWPPSTLPTADSSAKASTLMTHIETGTDTPSERHTHTHTLAGHPSVSCR